MYKKFKNIIRIIILKLYISYYLIYNIIEMIYTCNNSNIIFHLSHIKNKYINYLICFGKFHNSNKAKYVKSKWYFLCNNSEKSKKFFQNIEKSKLASRDVDIYNTLSTYLFTEFVPSKNCKATTIVDCDYVKLFNLIFYTITCECPYCHEEMTISQNSDYVPHTSNGFYLCPNCLGYSVWDVKAVRNQVWDIFEQHKAFKKWKDHQQVSKRAVYTLRLAQALLPLARIRFGLPLPAAGHLVLEPARVYWSKTLRLHDPSLDYYTYDNGVNINRYLVHKWNEVFLNTEFENDRRLVLHSEVKDVVEHLNYDSPNHIPADGIEIHSPDAARFPWFFSEKEQERADRALRKMGIPSGSRIACLLVRDGLYEKSMSRKNTYFMPYRNADIDSYKEACVFLAERGWYVLRMGFISSRPIQWESDRIIDYSTKYRDPFMDLYLFSHCDLCVTTASGLDIIPQLMHIPTVFTNYFCESHCNPAFGPSVLINKHIYIMHEMRELSIDEYISNLYKIAEKVHLQFTNTGTKTPLEDIGIHVIDNSPKEIKDAVKECLDMMNGRTDIDDDALLRQNFVWNIQSNSMKNYRHPLARYGTTYLYNVPLNYKESFEERFMKKITQNTIFMN